MSRIQKEMEEKQLAWSWNMGFSYVPLAFVDLISSRLKYFKDYTCGNKVAAFFLVLFFK